jgi:hypothetical protein
MLQQILTAVKEVEINTIQQTTDSSGCTPLHWAAGSNHLPLPQHLLNPSPTPLFQPNYALSPRKAKGRSALHYACRNWHLDVVKVLLLQHTADPHARAKYGVTPFQLAVWKNHLHVYQYMTREIGNESKLEVNDFESSILPGWEFVLSNEQIIYPVVYDNISFRWFFLTINILYIISLWIWIKSVCMLHYNNKFANPPRRWYPVVYDTVSFRWNIRIRPSPQLTLESLKEENMYIGAGIGSGHLLW